MLLLLDEIDSESIIWRFVREMLTSSVGSPGEPDGSGDV
jgi:hypothetical protein